MRHGARQEMARYVDNGVFERRPHRQGWILEQNADVVEVAGLRTPRAA